MTPETEINQIRNRESNLKKVESLCLDFLTKPVNYLDKGEATLFRLDEEGNSIFTGFENGKVIDYLNLIFRENNLLQTDLENFCSAISDSANILGEKGYGTLDEAGKIKAIFSWAKKLIYN